MTAGYGDLDLFTMRSESPASHSLNAVALDVEQQRIVDRLDRLGAGLLSGTAPRGIYLHGAVGRGKTWLCDRFFEQLPIPAKRRVHFHSFFRQLHQSIWDSRMDDTDAEGEARNAIDSAIATLLIGVDLLYFDEFHVHDSGNAALIHRVLAELFASDVTLLATSNFPPKQLLPGPFHHVFDAGIELLQANLDIVELEGATDYRRSTIRRQASGFARGHWLVPGTDAQLALVPLMRPAAAERSRLTAGGHRFMAKRTSDRQLWFSFAELCERDTSVSDYLEWVDDFDTWVLDGVPPFGQTSAHAAQRFANLVDVLCDRGVTLHVLSEHPREQIATGEQLPLDVLRITSRLAMLHPE